ncbi:MAG: hypothetical protein WCP97_01945 [bacterium]
MAHPRSSHVFWGIHYARDYFAHVFWWSVFYLSVFLGFYFVVMVLLTISRTLDFLDISPWVLWSSFVFSTSLGVVVAWRIWQNMLEKRPKILCTDSSFVFSLYDFEEKQFTGVVIPWEKISALKFSSVTNKQKFDAPDTKLSIYFHDEEYGGKEEFWFHLFSFEHPKKIVQLVVNATADVAKIDQSVVHYLS